MLNPAQPADVALSPDEGAKTYFAPVTLTAGSPRLSSTRAR